MSQINASIDSMFGVVINCTPRALRPEYYETRYRLHERVRDEWNKIPVPQSAPTLRTCRKCRGQMERISGYLKYVVCDVPDCHCGKIVTKRIAMQPCRCAPGTEEKQAIMSARYAHGAPVPDDLTSTDLLWIASIVLGVVGVMACIGLAF